MVRSGRNNNNGRKMGRGKVSNRLFLDKSPLLPLYERGI
jgi:hypothetical protein